VGEQRARLLDHDRRARVVLERVIGDESGAALGERGHLRRPGCARPLREPALDTARGGPLPGPREHLDKVGPPPLRYSSASPMAVPKQKQSHSRTSKRRAQHKISAPSINACPQCHQPRRPHRVCPHCGSYGGREVVDVSHDHDHEH
jgi:large subunit ribosomal protein L32